MDGKFVSFTDRVTAKVLLTKLRLQIAYNVSALSCLRLRVE